MPYRKNVFIVGAGFSANAGAPVIQDFFPRAMELWKDPSSGLAPDEREVFRSVFAYRKALEIAEARVQVDLENIEDLFGTVEMASQLGISEPQAVRRNLVYVILRTLELTTTSKLVGVPFMHGVSPNQRETNFQGDIYEFFVQVVAQRWFPRPKDGVAKDSVISLNYDLLLERAMEGSPIAPLYDLPSAQVAENAADASGVCRVRLLKLHGSANWAICSNCRNRIYVLRPNEASVVRLPNTPRCETCNEPLEGRLVVPPTWNKEEYRSLLSSVWQSAARELASAQRIIIIGYSMPLIDKFFQYLLALSLADNHLLDEVVVVNKNQQEGQRIAKFFRGLYERERAHSDQAGEFFYWVTRKNFQNGLHQIFPSASPAW
jgi:NAD-dependent SIR2 family protein deacetylase